MSEETDVSWQEDAKMSGWGVLAAPPGARPPAANVVVSHLHATPGHRRLVRLPRVTAVDGLGAGACEIVELGLRLYQMSGVVGTRLDVAPGGAADKAGVVTGDVMIDVNGANVVDSQLHAIMQRLLSHRSPSFHLLVSSEEHYKLRTVAIHGSSCRFELVDAGQHVRIKAIVRASDTLIFGKITPGDRLLYVSDESMENRGAEAVTQRILEAKTEEKHLKLVVEADGTPLPQLGETDGLQEAGEEHGVEGGEGAEVFQDLRLPEDVYACAFILACNATPSMYSFWPFNKQMWTIWLYLLFVFLSQSFALVTLTVLFPPMNSGAALYVDCAAPDSATYLEASRKLGFASTAACRDELDFAFRADVNGSLSSFHIAQLETPFYKNTFCGDVSVVLLKLLCCTWVFVHVLFRDIKRCNLMLEFFDFNRWFLPHKGEVLRNNYWVLLIPLTQWSMAVTIVSISWTLICGFDDPLDVVLNSMAFTFIAEISDTFAEPVMNHYGETAIQGLDPAEYGDWPTYFIVTEYDKANASETGWYITEDAKKAGLLTDFHIRHQPEKYSRIARRCLAPATWLFCACPCLALAGCWAYTHMDVAILDDIMLALRTAGEGAWQLTTWA